MKRRSAATLAFAVALAAGAWAAPASLADIIHLKDGTKVEGDLKKTDDGYVVTAADGTVTTVMLAQVKRIELKTPPGADEPQRRLESLRRSLENVTDPKLAISRYKEFVAKYPNTAQALEAGDELKVWQDRKDRNLTKAGDRWVTPQELGAIQQESLAEAIAARRLMKQGRLKEAAPVLEAALKLDPKNASALYLLGVLHARQDQAAPARKAFEEVSAIVPDHGPTLNNLAVLHWRQDHHVGALNFYDQAMLATPRNATILNNVAEALHALPEEYRSHATTKKVLKHFNEQDDELAEQMARQNKYRWGAAWVTGTELDKLQEKEEEIDDKIAVLQDDFDRAQDQLRDIDREIDETERSLRRIQADSYRRDSQGRPVRTPLPRVYYELSRDLSDLRGDRSEQQRVIESLRREAQRVKQQMPVPRYTGKQRPFDVEGTPLVPPGGDDAAGGAGGPRLADDPAAPDDGVDPPGRVDEGSDPDEGVAEDNEFGPWLPGQRPRKEARRSNAAGDDQAEEQEGSSRPLNLTVE